jgi:hypothetical protein
MDNAASNYSFPSGVHIMIQGACVANATFINNNNTGGQINWQQFSLNFTCANSIGPPSTIDFFNATPGPDNLAGLDDVFLDFAPATVPEPTTFAMAALGLVSVALVRHVRHHRDPSGGA